jgi:type 1 glutamine amidotransferase
MRAEEGLMRNILAAVAAIVLAAHVAVTHAADLPAVLVYSHNGLTVDGKKGYVHDNIPSAVKAIEKLGTENGFTVTVSDDPAVFTTGPLNKYRAIIFASSNNKAFDNDAEKKAFQDYIHGGGGFVGIHSATGSERDWPWYWQLIGGTFWFHAPLQKFTVNVVDKTHPATAFFTGDTWAWEDEFYVVREQPKDIHVLLAGNIKLLKMPANEKAIAAKLPDSVPLAWYHEFEGGRSFYTALGHKKEYYSDETFLKHLLGGIKWAMKMDEAK